MTPSNFETVGHHPDSRREIIRTIFQTQFNGMSTIADLAQAVVSAGAYNGQQLQALLVRGVGAECRAALKEDGPAGLPFAISGSGPEWRQLNLISFEEAQVYVDEQTERTKADIAKTNKFIRWGEARFDRPLTVPTWWVREGADD